MTTTSALRFAVDTYRGWYMILVEPFYWYLFLEVPASVYLLFFCVGVSALPAPGIAKRVALKERSPAHKASFSL